MKRKYLLVLLAVVLTVVSGSCQRSPQLSIASQFTLEGVGSPEGLGPSVTGKIGDTDFIFVAKGGNPTQSGNASMPGIIVFSLKNPDRPRMVSYLNAPIGSVAIDELHVSETTLYALTFNSLWIVDVSEPSAPKQASIFPAKSVSSIAISGRFAYLAGADGTLTILDISDPARPEEKATDRLTAASLGTLEASGSLLFSVAQQLDLYDTSSPLLPKLESSFRNTGQGVTYGRIFLPADFSDAAVSGDYVYVASGVDGVRVLDISDRNAPRQIARVRLPRYTVAWRVFLSGDLVWLVTGSPTAAGTSVELIDVSDPHHPRRVTSMTLPAQGQENSYQGFAAADNHVYVFVNRTAAGGLPAVVTLGMGRP